MKDKILEEIAEKNFITVSKNTVHNVLLAILILTFVLIILFATTDFDTILGVKNLALKVGQTTITKQEFKIIKSISGVKARNLTDSDFAEQLVNMLLLAEKGRKLKLDETPSFKSKIEEFDSLLNRNNASDTEKIAKSIYLIEELAKITLNKLRSINNVRTNYDISKNKSNFIRSSLLLKLHVKTILTKNKQEAEKVLNLATTGAKFNKLNSSFSVSLYRFVGGDLGWRTNEDFPEGVFAKLLKTPVGSITIGFNDENGFHLYMPVSKVRRIKKIQNEDCKNKMRTVNTSLCIQNILLDLRKEINVYICPELQSKCLQPDFDTN